MRTTMLNGEVFINANNKVIKIGDLEGTWCVAWRSILVLDTSNIDWYAENFIDKYRSYDTTGKYTFPYLVRNPKMWTYK